MLAIERNWVKAPRSETGWTEQLTYTLQSSFSTAERKKASRIRSHASQVGDDQAATVVQPPTFAESFGIGKFFQCPA